MSLHSKSALAVRINNARTVAIAVPLLLCSLAIAGCCVCPIVDHWSVFRDNRVALLFKAHEETWSSITITSMDTNISIMMFADGYRTTVDSNDYKLRLYLEVYDRGLSGEPGFHPENIRVFFDKKTLEYQGIRRRRGEHSFDIEFYLGSTDGTEPILNEYSGKPEYTITVDMSEFVLVDSAYVAVDTVYAIQREYIHVSENDDYSPYD